MVSIVQINPSNKAADNINASFITMRDIEGGYSNSFNYEIKEWGKIKKGFTHFQNEDIAFAKITPCFQNRKSLIFSSLENNIGAGTTELHVLRSFSKRINPSYLLAFIKSEHFIQYGISNFTGTAGQQRFPTDRLKEILIPLPPLSEQKRIAAKIEKLMPLIEEYDKNETELKELNDKLPEQIKKSILQYAIQGKLVKQNPKDEPASVLLEKIKKEKEKLIKSGKIKKEKQNSHIYKSSDNSYYQDKEDIDNRALFEIPKSWAWCRLVSIVQINPSNKAADNINASFITMRDIEGGYSNSFNYEIKEWGKIKKGFTHFQNEDIAFAKITPCFQNRKSIIFGGLENNIGAGTTELHVLRSFSKFINPSYLLAFIKSEHFIQYGISNFTGTAGQQRFPTDRLKEILIPLPPLSEQKRIVSKIELLFRQIDLLN